MQRSNTICTGLENEYEACRSNEQMRLELPLGSCDSSQTKKNACYDQFLGDCYSALGHPLPGAPSDPAPNSPVLALEGSYASNGGFPDGSHSELSPEILRGADGQLNAGLRMTAHPGAGAVFTQVSFDPGASRLIMQSDYPASAASPAVVLIVTCSVSLPSLTCSATNTLSGHVWDATFTRQ